jgi:hypothetical protein
MGYIQGNGRNQAILFPVVLDDLVPADHMCSVIDTFVEKLAMSELGFERAQAAKTGRPGYDPRDLLKLVSVWLPELDPLIPALGSGVPPQCSSLLRNSVR